jgi:hypothetical protein
MAEGLALVVVTVTGPFPNPLEGVTVIHVASSVTLQLVLEVIAMLPIFPEPESTSKLVEETDKVGVADD